MNASVVWLACCVLASGITLIALMTLLAWGVEKLIWSHDRNLARPLKLFGVALVAVLLCVGGSQLTTYTPRIAGDNAIAELRKIDVNGSNQWITVRGQNKNAPVILFLSGGPGGSQMGNARVALSELETDFVLVHWDQPGAAKSRWSIPRSEITLERYIADAHAVSQYLRQTFAKQKIYLIGESWGSALGVMVAQRYPQDYAAFIGSGQMVDFVQTEKLDYNLALRIARERGDQKMVDKLVAQGEPPYYADSIILDTIRYLQYLDGEVAARGQVHALKSSLYASILAPEYGLVDKYNWIAGLFRTFDQVFPQLYGVNFRESATTLKIPRYFLIGRHDLNAPTQLTEEYCNLLSAPKKELLWFEHGGHAPWNTEADRYTQEVRRIVADNPSGGGS